MPRVFIAICLVILLSLPALGLADSKGAPTSPDEPIVKIAPPPSHAVRQVLYFPLKLPAYALRAATLPIGLLSRLIERERIIERAAELLSNREKTLWAYPIIEGGAGTGFGGGMGLTHIDLFGQGYNLKLIYKNHIDLSQDASASFGKPLAFTMSGIPVSWATNVWWMRHTDEDYYGSGPSTTRATHSQFLVNHTSVGGGLAWQLLPPLSLNFGIGYDIATTGPNSEGSFLSVDQTFVPANIPAFGRWIHYISIGFKAQYDTRDNVSMTERGGLHSASITRFQHAGIGSYDYIQYELDGRHFFNLGFKRMVLALHGGLTFQQTTSGGQVPFYRLATLDANSPLRGFPRGRFRDRNFIILNAEYRFPVWDGIDGVGFVDTGRVFHSPSDLSFNDFKYSAGGGLRVRALGLMLLRLDIAYGGEGINTLLGISKSL